MNYQRRACLAMKLHALTPGLCGHTCALLQVSDALHLSRATLNKIRQNLCWAFGYNIVAIPLAAGALLPSLGIALTPSLSGALMGVSSLAVVSNSLLLQWELRNLKGNRHTANRWV